MTGKEFQKRFLYLIVGLGLGIILTFALGLIWIFIKGIILGYGDSGPDWVNTVTKWIEIITITVCAILSQIIFNYVRQKDNDPDSSFKKEKSNAVKKLYFSYSTIVGFIAGLFLGLFVFSSLFRVLLDILFGYGDSGPDWINVVIIAATLIITALCIYYSNKWTRNYLNKK